MSCNRYKNLFKDPRIKEKGKIPIIFRCLRNQTGQALLITDPPPISFTTMSKKSRIRETKHISTHADSSTDTTVEWTKNTPKPNFFEKRKKSFQMQKLKKIQKYAKISDTPFDQRSLIHREAWFPGGPRIPQNLIILKNGKNHLKRKNSKTSRDMPKLAIRPLTRVLLSIGKRGFHHVLLGKISKKKLFFARRFQTTSKQKCSNVKPLLSITFPQGFLISKNI